ncbi:outer membrane protein assembly factor BamD [Marinobacter pelagius]|uniref:Outer membrane lipoprotein n=1 Tax=Marinobacter pelagius TaxID=379482 RepID=A0A1I4SX93_9GAMM|nr:outer membrane protein assembly factor BamD [Marinobacter pelagius]SFM69074.1 Outer membrane lipoprotein [Marinobacter pelagius]
MNLSYRFLFLAVVLAAPVAAQESFRVELGRDGKTIGDMRPVFLKFESRPLPAISPAEVARRYQRLFENSDEPEVRVDALNRLTNIRDRSGQDVGYSPEQEPEIYEEVLGSYESILARGSFSGRLDELLYQMAKAHALTGEAGASIQRLKQLVGLYPNSPLVPEARFRIAESAFANGQFAEAETGYRALLEGEGGEALKAKARYMLGWSQFKQGEHAWERAAATFQAVLDGFLPTAESIRQVPESSVETIDDTLRVLALMASRTRGLATLDQWFDSGSVRPWEPLVFDRLADLYAITGKYEASVAVNEAFHRRYPQHASTPRFLAQIVEVWQMAGDDRKVRQARAGYVAAYSPDTAFSLLEPRGQSRWREYARWLADTSYEAATGLSDRGELESSLPLFAEAAGYYETLAPRAANAGPIWRLAGDARLQARQRREALENFRTAAYEAGNYSEAADAGWAAVVLQRDRVINEARTELELLAAEVDQFASTFETDARVPGAQADLATRWLEIENYNQAAAYAGAVLMRGDAATKEQYAAWLITARVRQAQQEFGLAERAWRQALRLIDSSEPEVLASDDRDLILKQLATSVYRQGERAAETGKVAEAVAHFRRVGQVLPEAEIAIRGRFDAANTLLKASEWQPAVNELQWFRRSYPNHHLARDIGEKLVYAYSQSGQPGRAADELLALASGQANPWPDKLRAAALYHEAGDTGQRDDLYIEYLATGPSPASAEDHILLQTMRHHLLVSARDPGKIRAAIVEAELASEWHSADTLQWSAASAIVLGSHAAAVFADIPLNHPLAESLDRKQSALEAARARFAQAERFGGEAVRSEILYRRAELYRELAQDLMASEVPAELNEMEAMQYQMLLEEEAYPFEEKALNLHAENHGRIAETGYDDWIGRSLEALARLHPGRYERSIRWMSGNAPEVNREEGDDA